MYLEGSLYVGVQRIRQDFEEVLSASTRIGLIVGISRLVLRVQGHEIADGRSEAGCTHCESIIR